MKILKFKLGGQFAFFKNPEVNSNYYFTFNNIHKVALMGILGSILGLKGYNQQNNDEYPEFYEKLRDVKLAIVPNGDVCPNKKIQNFNNSTMFYNKGGNSSGANLIVAEEWIENPSWTIYIKINTDNEIENELASRIMEYRYVYVPYLGKNDHFANITDVEIFNEGNIKNINNLEIKLDSFYLKGMYEDVEDDFFDVGDSIVRYREYLPTGLNKETNHYEYDILEYSTGEVKSINPDVETYSVNNVNISFI